MRKTRKILSLIVSIAMLLSMFTFAMPTTTQAATGMSCSYDGSTELWLNQAAANNLTRTFGHGGIGGKAADDVAGFVKVPDGVSLGTGGGCYTDTPWYYKIDEAKTNNRALMAMDVLFTDVNAKLSFEFQGIETHDSTKSISFGAPVFISAANGVTVTASSMTVTDADAPASLSLNEWHNIAVEVANDGTNALNVYIDGDKYEYGLKSTTVGTYRFRVNVVSGSFYIDNYYCYEDVRGTDMYLEENYAMTDITVVDTEKLSYNEEEKQFALLDDSLTVDELKAAITTDYNVTVYEDASYKKVLEDADLVSVKSVVVVSNGKGYKYYDISPLNNTKFAIEIISEENKTARVTGFNATTVTDEDDFSTLEIPGTIMDYTITEIAEAAFFENEEIENVILPDSVEVIGANAFCGKFVNDDNDKQANGSIKSVVLPAGIKTIGSKAFAYNAGLTQITFPEGLETIASQAFAWSGIEEVTLPDSVTTIDTGAFIGYSIGEVAYGKIKTLNLPANLKSIGANAFSDNGALTQVTFPEGLETIGDGAFAYSGLEEVILPDSVTTIGKNAFTGYSVVGQYFGKIKTVKLSANLKSIGSYAFSRNPITEIEFPEGLEYIGDSAFYWTSIREVSLPNSVTYVGLNAFRLAPVKYLKLSNSLTDYSKGQFSSASTAVNDLIIPASVTNIGPNVFRDQDKDAAGEVIPDTDNTGKMTDVTVYGVKDSYAETWADKYNFTFKEIIGDIVFASSKIYGDGSKELAGTDFELRYGYENLTYKANLINIASEDKTLTVTISLADENGDIITSTSKDISLKAEEDREITEADEIKVDVTELKAGYKVKVEITNKADGSAVCAPVEYTFSDAKKEVRALLIANSFGNDSFEYLNEIAAADDVVLKVQNMYIGGAPLTSHYKNMSQDLTAYQPVTNGVYGTAASASVQDALESDKWDVVALQAATHGYSADYSFVDYATWQDDEAGTMTGTPNVTTAEMLTYIRDYVSTYAPTAKKVMHMSWGPCEAQSRVMYDNRFADEELYPDASQAVFELQKSAYDYASSIYSDVAGQMVPTSIAVQYALGTLGYQEHSGETDPSKNNEYQAIAGEVSLYRDETCHLTSGTSPYGRVLAGLTWYEYLTGNDVRNNPYQHSGIAEDVMAKLKEAAHYANQQVVALNGSKPVITPKKAEITISAINGTVKIYENGEYKEAPSVAEYEAGTVLKYVASPADENQEFLYWVEEAIYNNTNRHQIISTEEELEITAGTDVKYVAMYADKVAEIYYVTFKANNKIIAASTTTVAEIPSDPYMAGYVFDAWYNTSGVRLETDSIDFVALTENTMYVAGFKADKTTYQVTVVGAKEQGGDFVYNQEVKLTPAGEAGKQFAYWERDGKIVSYNEEYSFYVSGKTDVKAVYAEDVPEEQIVLVMAEPVVVGENSDKIGFYAERNVPDKYTVIETGILMSESSTFDINTAGIIKAKAKSTAAVGQFTVRKGDAKNQTWYAKAYLIYNDGEKTYTVYSNTVSKTVK